MTPAANKVAVVVPVHRAELDEDQRVSLRHLNRFLAAHDRWLVMPKSLDFGLGGFRDQRFADRWFASRHTYSALMLNPRFYRSFRQYEYILVYQLDCLVFRDELLSWCDQGYDYIGAVHTIGDNPPVVGNGGFSLRRIRGCLNVLESKIKPIDPDAYWREQWAEKPRLERWPNLPRKWVKRTRAFNGVRWEIRKMNRSQWDWPEDWFWSLRPQTYWPPFRLAPNEAGFRFSFSGEPERTFEAAGRRLPFGCNGWSSHGRDFWQRYLVD